MSRADLSPLFTWRSAIAESDLQPTVRHVALTLSLHMSERGDSCFPSLETLASETGLSKRRMPEFLRSLEEAGFLRVRRSKGGRGRPNHYAAVIPSAQRGDPMENRENRENRDIDGQKQGPQVPRERHEDVLQDLTPYKQRPQVPVSSHRPRDPLFDAVALAWLETLDPDAIRGRAAARIGTAKAELDREYGATPEEVREFAVQWRRHYPGADCTPQAITDNWPAFLAGVLASPRSDGPSSPVQRALAAAAELEERGL